MPAYQAAATLDRAIESVRAQQFDKFELRIVDDGSRDATAELAAAHMRDDPRILVHRHVVNRGAAVARNRAIRAARGRYIAFLDADDTWTPDKLARQVGFMQARGHAFTYTGFWYQSADSGARQAVVPPARVSHDRLLRGNVIGCLTAIYDRHQLGRVEMPHLTLRQDYALWLALLRRLPFAYGLTDPLATHYRSAGSLSAQRGRALMATWRMYRQTEGLSRAKSAWCLGHHLTGRLWRD
ncbi:MAG: glycosyltransferase family 2 protein [Rhodobacteraceae bacterium]|nr:glycosyltransferase family 2 protein [Paracoccaceae bacterium]